MRNNEIIEDYMPLILAETRDALFRLLLCIDTTHDHGDPMAWMQTVTNIVMGKVAELAILRRRMQEREN